MALLAISLPVEHTAREMLALLEVIQCELLPSPEDGCLVTRDAHGNVRVLQRVTARGASGTFWITLVHRLLALRERRASARGDAFSNVLRPGASTLFVLTRSQPTFDSVLALTNAVGGHALHMKLSRESEFALNLAGLMLRGPDARDAA